MTRPSLALLAATIALAGCANTMVSDDRIKDNTAMALGVPSSAVAIANRRYDGATNTYYTATTVRGSYNCTLNGGGLLAAGMTNPPQCSRQ